MELADSIAKFLDNFGRWRERDEVMRTVASSQMSVASTGPLTKMEFLMESRKGETLWSLGRAAEAEQVFRRLLARMDAGAAYETGYDRVVTLQRLGRCLRARGQQNAAADAYRRALAAAEPLEQTDQVKRTTWRHSHRPRGRAERFGALRRSAQGIRSRIGN